MTLTYLTLNPQVGSISDLVLPNDPPDVKAPLRFKWQLWVQTDIDPRQQDTVDYKDSTRSIAEFDTVGSFWSVFSAVPQPSVFAQGLGVEISESNSVINSLMLFRRGVSPEWEDPVNADGGHFQFHWRPNGISPAQLDEYWNNLVLAVVGNTIEAEGEFSSNPIIQGVRFVNKLNAPGKQAGFRIEVWFSKATDPRHLQKVRTKLEKSMALHLDGTSGHVPRCDVRYHSSQ
jgi:translation initiation factor 4E